MAVSNRPSAPLSTESPALVSHVPTKSYDAVDVSETATSAATPPNGPSALRSRFDPVPIVVAAALAVVVWLVVRFAAPDFFVASTMRELSDVIDIPPFLAKLLEVSLYFFGFAIFGSLFSFSGERRRNATILFLVGFFIVYGGAWYLTRDVWFDKDGDPRKCYVTTNDGVVLFDTKRVDPGTGKGCVLVSKELAPALRRMLDRQSRGEPTVAVDPEKAPAFSQVNGESLLWYFEKENGEILFYDVPGFDQDSGKPWKKVTQPYWRASQKRIGVARIGDMRLITRSILARSPDDNTSGEIRPGTNVTVDGIEADFAFVREDERPWKVKLTDLNSSSRRLIK